MQRPLCASASRARFGCSDSPGWRPGRQELPLGVLRLVELARALAGDPQVLLVDEVSVGLDAGQVAQVARVLALVAREGAGVLLVEHDLGMVSRLAQLAYVLDAGRVVAAGPIDRVLADQRVRRLW